MQSPVSTIGLCLIFSLVSAATIASDMESRIEQLEAEVAALQSRDPGFHDTDLIFDSCPEHCGWTAACEYTFLKFHDAGVFRAVTPALWDFGYELAPRILVGYSGPTGVGIRARYWDFTDHKAAIRGVFSETASIDTFAFDLELTNLVEIGQYWTALVSGGWRYVDYEENITQRLVAGGLVTTARQLDSAHLGATLGGELHAQVQPHATLFASARGSILFGDRNELTGDPPTFNGRTSDTITCVWESQLGAERRWHLSEAEVFVRIAAEVQFWDNTDFAALGSSVGFSGFTAAIGFTR